MTVLEVIQRSTEFLAKRGVDSPRLNVELLLSHVLGVPRLRLYLAFDRTLTETELDQLRELVRRRGERVPLQHLTGSTSFLGLELSVTTAALIPRPETEVLAQLAIEHLKARREPTAVLDFGTGTGCLAISIAKELPEIQVTALDASAVALELARANARRHGVETRIVYVEGNGLGVFPESASFDLIVSNPPYIPTPDLAALPPEVRDHDPRLALDGGDDGLRFYREFARQAGGRLKPRGVLMAELGDGQAAPVRDLFAAAGWEVVGVEKDLSGRERVIIVRALHSG